MERCKRCKRCLDLTGQAVGDLHVNGWLQSDPTGILRNSMERVQTSWICQNCTSRWSRTKMKLSGAVRWTEADPVKQTILVKSDNALFLGLSVRSIASE